MTEEILYDVADGIGTITLNRPQARNALTFAMYEGLAKICSDPESHGAPGGRSELLQDALHPASGVFLQPRAHDSG